jgi:hypothetical protein
MSARAATQGGVGAVLRSHLPVERSAERIDARGDPRQRRVGEWRFTTELGAHARPGHRVASTSTARSYRARAPVEAIGVDGQPPIEAQRARRLVGPRTVPLEIERTTYSRRVPTTTSRGARYVASVAAAVLRDAAADGCSRQSLATRHRSCVVGVQERGVARVAIGRRGVHHAGIDRAVAHPVE